MHRKPRARSWSLIAYEFNTCRPRPAKNVFVKVDVQFTFGTPLESNANQHRDSHAANLRERRVPT